MKHFVTSLIAQIKTILSRCGIEKEVFSLLITEIIVVLLVILLYFIPSFQW